MQKRWTPILLTVSQAYFAGALPAPQFFGQSGNPQDPDCNLPQSALPNHSLTSIILPSGANGAAAFTHGPPIENSWPQGNPFQSSAPLPSNQPNQPDFVSSGPSPAPSQWGNPSFPQESSISQATDLPLPSYGPSPSPATPSGDHGANFGGNPGSNPGWNNGMANNGHEFTYVDPNLSIRTVTMTDLPASQAPTVTSASQNFPDTTGVSLYQSELSV